MDKRPQHVITATLVVLLAGCATTRSSGVLKVGPDTFTISTTTNGAAGGELGAKQSALEEANRYCSDQKREILVANIDSKRGSARDGHATLIFRCLLAGDPDLKRPIYQPTPSTVIEDRRAK
jgi:hypothetical protein